MVASTRFLSKLVVTLAACMATGVLGGSASAASPEPLPIRIGWQPSGEFRFFIAKELKLFEQAGLKPTYIKFVSGPPTLAALKSGDIDVSPWPRPRLSSNPGAIANVWRCCLRT